MFVLITEQDDLKIYIRLFLSLNDFGHVVVMLLVFIFEQLQFCHVACCNFTVNDLWQNKSENEILLLIKIPEIFLKTLKILDFTIWLLLDTH